MFKKLSFLVLLCQIAEAQTTITLPNYTCNYYGKKVNEKAVCMMYNSFVSRKEAEVAVDQIVKRSGLKKNFYVMDCPNIDNCFAATQNGVRLIVYDPAFMKKVNNLTKTDWGGLSILAHEIGHHLQGHTIDGEASAPEKELEADYFSGFVMYQMGANLKDAQAAINRFQDDFGSSTHPPRATRLASIAKGYDAAQQLYPNIPKTSPIMKETEPEPEVVIKKPTTGCIEGDCMEGFGIAVNSRTYEKYEGDWSDGKRHGIGTEYLANGNMKYEGDYENGKWHGNGVLYFPNGDRYVGNFEHNKINEIRLGHSYIQYKNGDRYMGQFKDGKKHGMGTIYYADGTKANVRYINNKQIQ